MNWTLFKDILSIDSTSGKERDMALWLNNHLEAPHKELMEVGDGTLNLFLSWGTARVVFCTHMDTVPPYIAPTFPEEHKNCHTEGPQDPSVSQAITGRGSCDAKGQLFAMYTACKQLEAEGCTDFGMLILAGEETGSWGAKAFSKTGFTAPFLIVGEPTENKMVSAAKGTLSYDLKFTGEAFHSGYPQCGTSAVELFNQFYNALKAVEWGVDPELGDTTWNIGLLSSPNPQNILSPELTCRLYFRTTFLSHQAVQDWMADKPATTRGGDIPARYVTLPGFESAPVAFGSDAPHLTGFGHKIICGPGSIKVAHRDNENVLAGDLEKAVEQYVKMCRFLQNIDNK